MNIDDFLIVPEGKDWALLLNDWVPPLPRTFTMWLVNRVGDAFVVVPSGAVLRLDVGAGTCNEVARNREEFAQRLATGDHIEQWLRVRLVEACRRAGMQLSASQCYGFRIPPTLGGKYEVSNIKPTELAVHYSYQAYICKQADIYWVPPG